MPNFACPFSSLGTIGLFFIASFLNFPAFANNPSINSRSTIYESVPSSLPPYKPEITLSQYILGAGDSVLVELLKVPEFSGVYSIGPDGTLYLPRLRSLLVEGLTIEELRFFLIQQYSTFVKDPDVYVAPVAYRPIKVYIGGEVARPGYYHLTGRQVLRSANPPDFSTSPSFGSGRLSPLDSSFPRPESQMLKIKGVALTEALRLPTVFDALRLAGGVTPFSKLDEVLVTRRQPLSDGGGKIRTSLDFLSLITEGNESQNIKLFDGDSIVVSRSPVELREQIIKAGQTNLSPDFVDVYVTGRVRDSGIKILPQGATLDQALASAGGQKILRGGVEFIRFNRDGTTDKRKFFLGGSSPAGSYKNPILISGDVVRVSDSPLSAAISVLDELTGPAVGIYSVYSLFDNF